MDVVTIISCGGNACVRVVELITSGGIARGQVSQAVGLRVMRLKRGGIACGGIDVLEVGIMHERRLYYAGMI